MAAPTQTGPDPSLDRAALLIARCAALAGPGSRDTRLDAATEIVRIACRSEDPETELLGRRLRVVALLEGGEVAAADAEIQAFASTADRLGETRFSWCPPLWLGMRALLQGRFGECERRNAEAVTVGRRSGEPDAEAVCTLQLFGLRLAQDRVVELEPLARSLSAQPHGWGGGATLACLLGVLGRDGEAGAELARLAVDGFAAVRLDARWLATTVVLAELAATLDKRPEATLLYGQLLPHARNFAVDAGAATCHGSVSRQLGLLAHTLGRWDDADTHFSHALADNSAAGAPLLVAHTSRQWAALLRARDIGGDWERGLELLAGAEVLYRRLGVDRMADEARQVLARSHEPPASERQGANNAFHRDHGDGDAWILSYGGVEVRLDDSLGLHDLAALLANPGRSFHVTDLAAGVFVGGVGHADQAGATGTTAGGAGGVEIDFDGRARAEYRARLAELDQELADGERFRGPVDVSLALAERDAVAVALAGAAGAGHTSSGPPTTDPVERARRAVGARMRLALDRIEDAHPTLGRHLRHSVRTGIFCSYEPEIPTTWPVSRPGA